MPSTMITARTESCQRQQVPIYTIRVPTVRATFTVDKNKMVLTTADIKIFWIPKIIVILDQAITTAAARVVRRYWLTQLTLKMTEVFSLKPTVIGEAVDSSFWPKMSLYATSTPITFMVTRSHLFVDGRHARETKNRLKLNICSLSIWDDTLVKNLINAR